MNDQVRWLYIAVLGWGWKIERSNLIPGWGIIDKDDGEIEFEYHIKISSPTGSNRDIYLTQGEE